MVPIFSFFFYIIFKWPNFYAKVSVIWHARIWNLKVLREVEIIEFVSPGPARSLKFMIVGAIYLQVYLMFPPFTFTTTTGDIYRLSLHSSFCSRLLSKNISQCKETFRMISISRNLTYYDYLRIFLAVISGVARGGLRGCTPLPELLKTCYFL